ncbi:MAG: hypothetical protein RR185_08180, partial [Angelakisella sp.]
TANGIYFAFARDYAENVSTAMFFSILQIDKTLPTIGSIAYSGDNQTIMVSGRDYESGVKGIYLNGTLFGGATVSWDMPEKTRYVRIQVEDMAGNRSEEVKKRVPGWFDVLETITLLPVKFIDDNQKAVVTAKSDGEKIAGIYCNGRLQPGNPVTIMVTAGTQYLELQAVDKAGDRSAVYRVRVPGWSQEVTALSIVGVRFSSDNTTAQITAMDTADKGIRGVRVNGELLPGNPVIYSIPAGTTHLKMQAEDNNGDRSAVLIRRVPGWSEVVATLTVTDVTFTDYNTTAQITATATGGDSVAGIIVNEKRFEGNPVIYSVPKDTPVLHIQAVNAAGDRSPMVNKTVPLDSSKSTLKLSIVNPGWTRGRSARIRLAAEDKNRITKVLVRTAEDREWSDVTEQRYIDITANTTVYASVENDKGESKEVSELVECFDREAPKVTAIQDGKLVNIRATDAVSGVTAILVNNQEYQREDIDEGKLVYRIPDGTELVIIKAEDAAGNLSRQLELPLQTTITAVPVIVSPNPPPPPPPLEESPPQEIAIPTPMPEPEPMPQLEPTPEAPEPSQPVINAEPEPVSPAAKAVAAVGGLGTTTLGGVWYWLRKKALKKPIAELERMASKLLYDETGFGGSDDPLDKKGE